MRFHQKGCGGIRTHKPWLDSDLHFDCAIVDTLQMVRTDLNCILSNGSDGQNHAFPDLVEHGKEGKEEGKRRAMTWEGLEEERGCVGAGLRARRRVECVRMCVCVRVVLGGVQEEGRR